MKNNLFLYLHRYLQKSDLIFRYLFCFCLKTGFGRISKAFNSFLLVYTNILEQKRIAGQA